MVVKADGLAAGKGVVVAHSTEEACCAVDDMLVHNAFGSAGQCAAVNHIYQESSSGLRGNRGPVGSKVSGSDIVIVTLTLSLPKQRCDTACCPPQGVLKVSQQ